MLMRSPIDQAMQAQRNLGRRLRTTKARVKRAFALSQAMDRLTEKKRSLNRQCAIRGMQLPYPELWHLEDPMFIQTVGERAVK